MKNTNLFTIVRIYLFIFVLAVLSVNISAQVSKCANTDYDCQIAEYTKLIVANSNDIESYYTRGRAYYNKGSFDLGIADFSRYIAGNPGNAEYLADGYNNRGLCYKSKKNYVQAVADFAKAIEANPQDKRPYFNRGNVYREQSKYDAAVIEYGKSIEIDPNYSSAYMHLGLAYISKKDPDRAIVQFNKVLEIDPGEPEGYYNRGVAYDDKRSYSKSIQDYTKYIALSPAIPQHLADGYYNRGIAYFHSGNSEQAIRDYTKAIEIQPNKINAYQNRAYTYRQMKKIALAEADEQRAAELQKHFPLTLSPLPFPPYPFPLTLSPLPFPPVALKWFTTSQCLLSSCQSRLFPRWAVLRRRDNP